MAVTAKLQHFQVPYNHQHELHYILNQKFCINLTPNLYIKVAKNPEFILIKSTQPPCQHSLTWPLLRFLLPAIEQFWAPNFKSFGCSSSREFCVILVRTSVDSVQGWRAVIFWLQSRFEIDKNRDSSSLLDSGSQRALVEVAVELSFSVWLKLQYYLWCIETICTSSAVELLFGKTVVLLIGVRWRVCCWCLEVTLPWAKVCHNWMEDCTRRRFSIEQNCQLDDGWGFAEIESTPITSR